jgi:ABC-2 type transport system ATP-binding protein
MSLLEVTGLIKSFGSLQAVKNISFTIREGKCTTLLGPNGAGKTTTLKMLAGLLKPTSGTIQLSGVSSSVKDIREQIGYLPQYPAFYNWMTGREYLIYVGRLSHMNKKIAIERADELLPAVGLADARNRRISGYSGGMQQRLGLAQAMMHRPQLIILDEPVSALDPIGRREVLDMMKNLQQETSILFSTHVLPDAEEITDDLLIMHAGEIVMAGGLVDIMEEHRQPVIRLRAEHSLERWREKLGELPGVERLSCHGDQAELIVSDRALGRTSLIKLLSDNQIAVRKLEISELSLEELFMKAVSSR